MTRIYLAGPFFSERQIEIIDSVEKALAKNETITEVYSPRLHQEGTHEPLTKLRAKDVYELDMEAIRQSDVIVAILDFDGKEVDPGTAYEIGVANMLNKPVVTVKLDCDIAVNIMLTESATAFFDNPEGLSTYDFKQCPSIEYTGKYR